MSVPRKVVGKDPWAPRAPSRPEPAPDADVEVEDLPEPFFEVSPEEAPESDSEDVRELDSEGVLKPDSEQDTAEEPELAIADPAVTDEEFDEMVEAAIESIPPELSGLVENCAFIVEYEPSDGRRNLLGLYNGRPLTTRQSYYGVLPDTITIYQGPLMRYYPHREMLREQVRKTVIHEIGHHFGFDDHELRQLGW